MGEEKKQNGNEAEWKERQERFQVREKKFFLF